MILFRKPVETPISQAFAYSIYAITLAVDTIILQMSTVPGSVKPWNDAGMFIFLPGRDGD